MLKPNLYIYKNQGIHQYIKDKKVQVYLLQQHRCGDWQIVRPATPEEIKSFEAFGVKQTSQEIKES